MDHMEKKDLKRLIDAAMRRIPADTVFKNCKIINVCTGQIDKGDIAVIDGKICGCGFGDYEGIQTIDAEGRFASPGLIDSHIHIESTYTTPEEFGRMVVPHGTTTVVADPHEIMNVCGLEGFNYMIRAAEKTELSVRYMMPSCVPATPFEDAGSIVNAFDMQWPMGDRHVPGLGEFMNYPGIINTDPECLNKILVAKNMHKVIDGHSPGLSGYELNAYTCAGIQTDHECSTLEEMQDRLSRGMYVEMREGSACHNLEDLIPGITPANSHRLLLCSDDRQPKTILTKGHIDCHLRMLTAAGIDPVSAVSMATANAAACYRLEDRGMLVPGKRADIVFFDDLEEFKANEVWIEGKKVAEKNKYLLDYDKCDISSVRGSMHVRKFSCSDLQMHLKSSHVKTIQVVPGGVVTKSATADIKLTEDGDFKYDPNIDIAKIAVLERHHNTGKIGLGLIKDYGIHSGSIACSVSHDSHNVICVGVDNREMDFAIHTLIDQEGGFVVTENGSVLSSLPLPVAGLMSDKSGEEVSRCLTDMHNLAYTKLGVNRNIEPVMTLTFMALIVIPALKLTDRGLFDVSSFSFTDIEA